MIAYTNSTDSIYFSVLVLIPEDADAIATKLVALIQIGKFDEAVGIARAQDSFAFEEAYCLYRLGRVSVIEIVFFFSSLSSPD